MPFGLTAGSSVVNSLFVTSWDTNTTHSVCSIPSSSSSTYPVCSTTSSSSNTHRASAASYFLLRICWNESGIQPYLNVPPAALIFLTMPPPLHSISPPLHSILRASQSQDSHLANAISEHDFPAFCLSIYIGVASLQQGSPLPLRTSTCKPLLWSPPFINSVFDRISYVS